MISKHYLKLFGTFLVAIALPLVGCSSADEAPGSQSDKTQTSGTAAGTAPGGAGRSRGQRAAAVIVQPAVFKPKTAHVEAVGNGRAQMTAALYPAVGGEVTTVLFTGGERVKAGTPLVVLDARAEKLAVELAQVAVREAEQLLARYRRIEDTGAISDSQIDEAETAVEGAKLTLEQRRVTLADRTITAPFDGYLGIAQVDPGARITPTTLITQIDARETLFVDFAVPEEVFQDINIGDSVDARPFSNAGQSLQAQIIGIDTQIDPARRSFLVRAKIDNRQDFLRPGMSFRIGFDAAGQDYAAIPEAAISWGSDGAYIWIVEDAVARRKAVTIAARDNGEALVAGDVSPGDLVVIEGVQKVREGGPAKIVEQRPARSATSSGRESAPVSSRKPGAAR